MTATVLIVENDASARLGLRELLEHAGYRVLVASSFIEGRRILRERGPDLLIADVRLDDYNGLQLVAAADIPAIVITGVSDPVIEQDARKLNADFLLKPVSPPDLLELIARRIRDAAARKASGAKRRWTRKPVTTHVGANVGSSLGRVVDVSYGGLRLEMASAVPQGLPPTFDVRLPEADLTIPVDLIWMQGMDGTYQCGVAVSQADVAAARAWFGLVDSVQ
jgi:DNA-binding response OmpR family regulator